MLEFKGQNIKSLKTFDVRNLKFYRKKMVRIFSISFKLIRDWKNIKNTALILFRSTKYTFVRSVA